MAEPRHCVNLLLSLLLVSRQCNQMSQQFHSPCLWYCISQVLCDLHPHAALSCPCAAIHPPLLWHEEGREEEGQVDVSNYRRQKTTVIEWHQTNQPSIFEGEIKEVDGWKCDNSIINLFGRFSFVGQNSRPSQEDETVASTLWKQKSSFDF